MSAAPKIPSAFEMKRRLDLALAEDMERNRAEIEAKGASHEAVGYVMSWLQQRHKETLREVAASSVEVDQLTAEHERLQAQTRALDQLSALIRDQATLDRIVALTDAMRDDGEDDEAVSQAIFAMIDEQRRKLH